MFRHGDSNLSTPSADRQNSGAMLLSMLKQAQKAHHQQQVLGDHGPQVSSDTKTALCNGISEADLHNGGSLAPAVAGSHPQPGTDQQQSAPVQPWQHCGSASTAQQQQPGSFPALFDHTESQQRQIQQTPVNLQRLFNSGGLGLAPGQPAAQPAAPSPAAGSNPLDSSQQWQERMQAQPLFSGLVDPMAGNSMQPMMQPAHAGFPQGAEAKLAMSNAAAAAADAGYRSSKGPPPGFPGIHAMHAASAQQSPPQQQPPLGLPYQPLHQQPLAQLHQRPLYQQSEAQVPGGDSQQLLAHWQQQQQQERLTSLFRAQGPMMACGLEHQPPPHQPTLQQQPFSGMLGQPSHLQLLTQQREQQQQQQHQQQPPYLQPQQRQPQAQHLQGFGAVGVSDGHPEGFGLSHLMARLQLQQQQGQQQQGLQQGQQPQQQGQFQNLLGFQHLQQPQPPSLLHQLPHQVCQQQQRPPHSQEDLLKQEQFQMLLSKLQPGDAGAVTATAAAAAAGAAAAASIAVASGKDRLAPVTGNRQQQQQQRQAALAGGMAGISNPQHWHAPPAPAAVAAHAMGGPASARSSSTGELPAAGANFLDQLSSSAQAGQQGFLRPAASKGSGPGHKRTTPQLPPPIRQDMHQLDQQLSALAEQLAPTAAQRQRQQVAWESVSGLLQQLWPQGQVHLFGSAANGLDIGNNNDLDVCLELEGVEETRDARGDVITELGQQLEEAGMKDVFAIPRARMPVVKFEHPHTGFKVDITVNNRLAVVNTKLLRDYASLDPRLRQLVLLVKHWAKRRRCNEAYVGTLSSYAYVLLCIAHCQARSPPVLPVLQEVTPFTHQRTIGSWCCDYNDDITALSGFGSANSENVAQLLTSFFFYWAHQHDFRRAVITVRCSTALTKAMKGWTTRVGMERHLFCIEDPFELSHDLGRTVHADGCDKLRHEFRRAWEICHRSSSPQQLIADLFSEAPAPPPLAAALPVLQLVAANTPANVAGSKP